MQEALSYLQSQVDSPADLRLGNLRDSTCNACELPYVLQQRRAGKIHVLEFVLCEAFSNIETAPATPASCIACYSSAEQARYTCLRIRTL